MLMEEVHVVRIPKEEIQLLKKSPKFLLLLRLCRYQNQLFFCYQSFLDYGLDTSPIGIRQRFNAMWFSCGVLYEAIKIVPNLGKEFRHFPSYQNGFASFLKDPTVTMLRTKILNKMRNSLVFHVDEDAMQEVSTGLNLSSYEFLAVCGGDRSRQFYSLADELVINAFVESNHTEATELDSFYALMEKLMMVMTHFSHCADHLIQEYIERKGWKFEEDAAFYRNPEDETIWDSTIE